MPPDPDPGLIQPKKGGVTKLHTYFIVAFAAIAWYNAVELVVVCLSTFKRYRGCYFWSLLVSGLSIIPNVLGALFIIYYLGLSRYVSSTLFLLTWYCMVTGHSLVLWSRLHLILQAPKVLRWILILIIVDAFVLYIPTTILLYGTISRHFVHSYRFAMAFNKMERIQLVGFTLQEFLLSGIYIAEAIKLLQLRPGPLHRRILIQLLALNVFIIILDATVVAIQFAGYYAIQIMFKAVSYSVKLKLEYATLNQLVQMAKGPSSTDPEQLSSSSQGWSGMPSGQGDMGSVGTVIPTMRQLSEDTISTDFSSPSRPRSDPH
ncbi:hypothetical protein BDV28DRAFT_137803 [Aspergillus coremiiformis]|uniref:DUF7703 domain-containing protein n=1 Tax=Aspergillus coremiiformis TaxID=138285 RepID=A0A5N6Z0C4_9EURO|nr:hypothetical protein BDV28DRAFT_137803 [Aspergillus coremiiformis]